jgi:hypothetical protein
MLISGRCMSVFKAVAVCHVQHVTWCLRPTVMRHITCFVEGVQWPPGLLV